MRFNSDYSVCHGDCLEVLQRVPDDSFDLSITDLPYGVTACAWDTPIDLEVMWKELLRVCKQNAAFIFTCTQPFTTALAHSKLELLRHEWIWEKPQGTNPFNAKHGPLRCHENILVFSRGVLTYNPQMTKGKPYSGFKHSGRRIGAVFGANHISQHRRNPTGERFPRSVVQFAQETGLHPTQKPVALMEHFIKTYSNEDEWVLDICMGSGTTGVACKRSRRKFVGIEKDQEYFTGAKRRIEETPVGLPTENHPWFVFPNGNGQDMAG
jgi:site-specific DNA-methyltransferase (adenine-specific)